MFSASAFSSTAFSASSGSGGVVGAIAAVVEIQLSATGSQSARGVVDLTLLSCSAQGGTGPDATLREFFRPTISSTGVVRATGDLAQTFTLGASCYGRALSVGSLNSTLTLLSAATALTSWSSASFTVVTFSATWTVSLMAGGQVATTLPLSLSAQARRGVNGAALSAVRLVSTARGSTSSSVVNQKIKLLSQSSGKVGRVATSGVKLSARCSVAATHGILGFVSNAVPLYASGTLSAHRVVSGAASERVNLIVAAMASHDELRSRKEHSVFVKSQSNQLSVFHV